MAFLQPLTGAGAASLGQSQKESHDAHCMACDSTKFISDLVPSGQVEVQVPGWTLGFGARENPKGPSIKA